MKKVLEGFNRFSDTVAWFVTGLFVVLFFVATLVSVVLLVVLTTYEYGIPAGILWYLTYCFTRTSIKNQKGC